MIEEMDLWSRNVALSYALLRIALGLNICLHGIVRSAAGLRSFAESLLPMFQKTPLPTWSVYSFGYLLPIVEATVGACVLFGFHTRALLDFGLGPHACPDVRVYLATRLADGRNPAHLFRGLFSIARGDSGQFL
jgi:hypothetical protein